MLIALVQWHPNGMTWGQVRSHAGLKNSGTFSAYVSDLRRGGFISENNELVYATQKAVDSYGERAGEAPRDTSEVLGVWRPKLRLGARRMLDVLVALKGRPISREDLAERSELTNSGTFAAYLGELKTAQLAVITPDGVAGNRETLFL